MADENVPFFVVIKCDILLWNNKGQDMPLFSDLMNQTPTKRAGVKPAPTLTRGHEASCPYVLGKNDFRI
ncbi:hypothetical protein KAW48_04260 [candidate division WOR-3 bacterium]|nr:hypothetical protein [candidate division WOR-3 bacterium]